MGVRARSVEKGVGMFDYHEPTTVHEAVALLAADEGARCLAGGATLVAMMNFGMLDPSVVVSLRRVEELHGIRVDERGRIRIGAMTFHREITADARIQGANEVLRDAAASIGVPIRNMCTIGGAVSHADPASDINTALVAAGAHVEIAGPDGRREVPIDAFFSFYLTTILEPGEVVTSVILPKPAAASFGGHDKLCRVHGDTPTIVASVTLALEGNVVSDARLVIGACGPVPLRDDDADAQLVGSTADDIAIERACAILTEKVDPPDDVRGSADFRRLLIPRIARRLVRRALSKREAVG